MAAALFDRRASRVLLISSAACGMSQRAAAPVHLETLRDLLTDHVRWGIPPDRCTKLVDPVTPTEIRLALEAAGQGVGRGGLLLVYYAGHITFRPDSGLNLELATVGARSADDSLFPFEQLKGFVGHNAAAGRLVILDCCHTAQEDLGPHPARTLAERAAIAQTSLLVAATTDDDVAVNGEAGESADPTLTGELIRLLSDGLPHGRNLLDLETITNDVAKRLDAAGRPVPEHRQAEADAAIALARNPALYLEDRTGQVLWGNPSASESELSQSVVLILSYNRDTGALGVVLNQPGTQSVSEVAEHWETLTHEHPLVFVGGPVAHEGHIALASLRAGVPWPMRFRAISDRLGSIPLSAEAPTGDSVIEQLRIFTGYLGWGPGELEEDLARKLLVPANIPDHEALSANPEGLWEQLHGSVDAGDNDRPVEHEPPLASGTAAKLADRLNGVLNRGGRITLFVGSGATGDAVPTVAGLLKLADDYAAELPDGSGLIEALQRARRGSPGDEMATYLAYRRAFAAWVSGNKFDVVAQEAVLRAYQPTDPALLANRGRWQRIEAPLGERLELDRAGWLVPPGVAALGALLAERSDSFNRRVLTTNFDPLLEVSVDNAGGATTSVALDIEGRPHRINPSDESVEIYHLHGYWRPDLEAGHQRLLHDPEHLAERRPHLAAQVAALIRSDTVLVIGHSGWDGILEDALRTLAGDGRRLTVLWAEHGGGDSHETDRVERLRSRLKDGLPEAQRPEVEIYPGVDSNLLIPAVARLLDVPVQQPARTARRTSHADLEREFISEAGSRPPTHALDLIRQLDRRFQWERSWAKGPRPRYPELIFWPIRLRSSPSVIHMVQALAAASISACHVRIVACLDDYNLNDRESSAERFKQAVERWFRHVPDAKAPEFISLRDFIESNEVRLLSLKDSTESDDVRGDQEQADLLVRETHPWGVAQELFGTRNPSVLSVLMAAKIIPDIPPDRLLDDADLIIRNLESKNARRLLTPLTVWSHLNYLLTETHAPHPESVVTLGGNEERRLWELWREVYDHPVGQLYNPQIYNLSNQSLMLQWSNADELREYLDQERARAGWDEPGRYFHWLVQNAFLLPAYLAGRPITLSNTTLDSWGAVRKKTVADAASTLDLVVKQVSTLYLGRP
jgi:putative AlgH/UPF0301 family transcriptional regulator